MDYLNKITKNTQRMSNVSIQGSKLTGDTKAQSFNIQALRIVRGYTNLNSSKSPNAGDAMSINNGLVIDEDGNRVSLQNGDVVLAVMSQNIGGDKLIPAPASNGGFNLYFCDINGLNGPGDPTLGTLFPIFYGRYDDFNYGYNYTIFQAQCVSPYIYLNIHSENLTILSNPIQKVGVSLLVANANVCQ
jgi:hypothetical protein